MTCVTKSTRIRYSLYILVIILIDNVVKVELEHLTLSDCNGTLCWMIQVNITVRYDCIVIYHNVICCRLMGVYASIV